MADGGLDAEEEWDSVFLEELVQAEEAALSAQASRQRQPPSSPPPRRLPPSTPSEISYSLPPWRPPQSPPSEISYSPPRQLSQRTHQTIHTTAIPNFHDSSPPREAEIAKERELSALQKEFNRVSQQLSHLEKECSELRKEKDKNLEQLKVLNSRIEAKDADLNLARNKGIDRNGLVHSPLDPGIHATHQNVKSPNKQLEPRTKSCAGRDETTEASTSALRGTSCCSQKLFDLWNSNDRNQGRALVAKLYKTCEMDFHMLFGYLNPPKNDSDMVSADPQCSLQPTDYAKVLHLHSVFTKISNDVLKLDDLLEALVDLCNLENVFIVHWSLCVLHKILGDSSSMENGFGERENVTVEFLEESISGNFAYDRKRYDTKKESSSLANVAEMLKQGQIPSAVELSNAKTPDLSGFARHGFAAHVSGAYQVSLFERMRLISTKNDDERVRCEALSIMNLILMRHNAYLERDKFAGELVFQSLSQLLRREAGFSVQDQAIHTLYLLCNCPKVIAKISSFIKEDRELTCSKEISANSFQTFQELNEILIGLADCVASYKSASAKEMKLRRNAISFLAFLGSLGNSGFEILLRLSKGSNFLIIILQSILLDLELQASKSAKRSGPLLEQSLLIREALILLNRLVSHPQYSVRVLNALTATRDSKSIIVEVANRLSQKSTLVWQDDNTTKQTRESEILELARVFKKRVFTFLGDHIS